MTEPAEELRAAVQQLRPSSPAVAAHTVAVRIPVRAADALADLLDLEETYLVGAPDNERLAHVRAALAVARAINGQQPRETGCAGAGEPQEPSDGSTGADTARGASQRRTGRRCACGEPDAPDTIHRTDGPCHIPPGGNAEDCEQCAGTNPPYPFTCPGHDTPDTMEIINPRNTGWYWHCTTCDAEAGKSTAESSARDAARTEHPQCPPDPDGPYAWTIPADQPDPDLNSLRQEIYTRLNREAEFVGCPSATTDDIVRLVRAWHEPSCDSHDASVDSTDAHHFRDTAKVIKDAEPAPDCNARDEPDSQHNPDLCTPTCWRTRHARYTTALIAAYTGPPTGRTDRMAVAAMDLADHETQQLRLQLGLVRSAAQAATENLKHRAERAEAALEEVLGRFERAWPGPDEPMRYRATVTADDYQRWRTALDQPPGPAATQATTWTPPPPGDTREQLPPHILALIRPYLRGYTSTACQTAGYLAEAIADRPEHRAELIEWRMRMRKRCRRNQKYTGEICPHHTKETTP